MTCPITTYGCTTLVTNISNPSTRAPGVYIIEMSPTPKCSIKVVWPLLGPLLPGLPHNFKLYSSGPAAGLLLCSTVTIYKPSNYFSFLFVIQ